MLTPSAPPPTAAPPDLGAVRQIAGTTDAAGLRFGIVISRYNLALTGQLLAGAVAALKACGAAEADIEVHWVPGAFEIPTLAEQLAKQGRHHALIALGCVIQGETPHAALINMTVAAALSEISRRHAIPVVDTVIPAHTEAQAVARCTSGPDGRGAYAARTAVEMARLLASVRLSPS